MRSVRTVAIALAVGIVASTTVEAGTITGTISAKGKGAADAVVYVDAIPGTTFTAPESHAVIDQKNMVFTPAVLPVLVGTTVDFRNSDDVLHNVFTPLPCADGFNLGTWGKGEHKSHTFTRVGCAAILLCSAHPEMQGYVLTVPTPYYATTDSDGTFAIEGVPTGTYSVRVWHGRLKKAKPELLEVVVTDAGSSQADFVLRK